MVNEQRNTSLGGDATHIIDGVATLSVTSPDAAFESQSVSDKSAGSVSSSAQEMKHPASTSSAQPPPSRPLWNTREGRIAGYKRMMETNHLPEQRANLEAFIRYYEDGGKVPEGQEELWAFDGQTSFGIRKYSNSNPPPEGWLYKIRYCDSSKWSQLNYWPKPDEYMIADSQGRVYV